MTIKTANKTLIMSFTFRQAVLPVNEI